MITAATIVPTPFMTLAFFMLMDMLQIRIYACTVNVSLVFYLLGISVRKLVNLFERVLIGIYQTSYLRFS